LKTRKKNDDFALFFFRQTFDPEARKNVAVWCWNTISLRIGWFVFNRLE